MTSVLGKAERARIEHSIREGAFAPIVRRSRPFIGAEAEFIPVDASTRVVCPVHGDAPATSMRMLRVAAARHGWTEGLSDKGAPQFLLPAGGTLGFEPGGQLEYGSPPCSTGSVLLGRLRDVVAALRDAGEGLGIELLTVGIDPLTPVEQAPLRLESSRYREMADYFATIGPFGARMMRQTAAFQVSVDLGEEPWRLWRVLNRMAPYLIAIFANSPVYAGSPTGHASYRAHCWRMLDPARTGIRQAADDPAGDYCDFALAAPAMFLPRIDGRYAPIVDHLAAGTAGLAEWNVHLTTLFPEIRPRGTFEIRSCDAVAPEWFAAPLAFIGGIAYDLAALRQADELLDDADPDLLVRAGRIGLADSSIATTARDLTILALDGCDALGEQLLSEGDRDSAREFFERYTFVNRAPADDARPMPAAPESRA